MPTSLGRIEPLTHHADGTPIDPDAPASPELLREMHADLVRGKGRALLTSTPLLALALVALGIGGRFPDMFGSLLSVGVVGVTIFAQEAYEWFTLRRADPLTLIETEARETAEERAFVLDLHERNRARGPYAALTLGAVITIVTVVEFVEAGRTSFSRVVMDAALVKPLVRDGEWWRLLTATYLHGNVLHLLGNLSALIALGQMLEAYEGRLRVPLVYLVAAIAGSLGSTLLTSRASVGASGGIMGLAGYLVVAAGRHVDGAPRLVRARMLRVIGSTAVMGLAAITFVDNGAHLGGLIGGAAIGLALPRGDARRERLVAALGAVAILVLAAGAVFTVARLIQ
jgi:membrane associated rhomboid family serine protease